MNKRLGRAAGPHGFVKKQQRYGIRDTGYGIRGIKSLRLPPRVSCAAADCYFHVRGLHVPQLCKSTFCATHAHSDLGVLEAKTPTSPRLRRVSTEAGCRGSFAADQPTVACPTPRILPPGYHGSLSHPQAVPLNTVFISAAHL